MRQVLRAGALERPRGMGWGGRWKGGSGWGTHVNPWLIRVNVWQKPLQYCKVISLQLVKINEKKKVVNVNFMKEVVNFKRMQWFTWDLTYTKFLNMINLYLYFQFTFMIYMPKFGWFLT